MSLDTKEDVFFISKGCSSWQIPCALCTQRRRKTLPCKKTIICSSSCCLITPAKRYLYISWLSTDDTSCPRTAISQPRFSIILKGCFRDGFMNWKRFLHYWPFIIPQPVAHGFFSLRTKDIMMTSSNRNIFRITGPLCGEFTGHRWISDTKVNDAELWCFLWSAPEWRLSKQSWGWWFETPSHQLWHHCYDSWAFMFYFLSIWTSCWTDIWVVLS